MLRILEESPATTEMGELVVPAAWEGAAAISPKGRRLPRCSTPTPRSPEVGEIEIEPTSTLDDVSIVGDIDGDDTADVVILSHDWKGSGGALVLFGSTLTRIFGGPNLDLPQIE